MRLEFVLHTESDVHLLKNYDEIFESLEEYEVQLHSMLGSKHVATYPQKKKKKRKRKKKKETEKTGNCTKFHTQLFFYTNEIRGRSGQMEQKINSY